MSVINTHSFDRLWPVSWTITHRFGVSEQFSLLRNPKVCLCVIHPHLPFWPILARFMGYYLLFWSILTHFVDYYSPFWGPGAIFMVAEPNVSLCAVHQHSLFWPILARFMGYKLPFGQFWPVSWSITHRFRLPERFPRLTIPGVRLHVGHQYSQFCPILARFVDYYSPF